MEGACGVSWGVSSASASTVMSLLASMKDNLLEGVFGGSLVRFLEVSEGYLGVFNSPLESI